MSQAEELLNSLTEDEIAAYTANPSNEPHIIVNSDRSITIPTELKNIAVQFDHNVETVTFDCPRYWDEHDLSAMQLFVIYLAPGKEPAHYPCNNVRVDNVDDSMMHFSWTISGNVTERDGQISFLICAKVTDEDGNLSNRWSSRLNQEMTVLKGMDASDEVQTLEPDVITNILLRLDVLENRPTGGGTGGTVDVDPTLSIEGMAADAKATGEKFKTLPFTVASDGYADVSNLRRPKYMKFLKEGSIITISMTLDGDKYVESEVLLNESGYPMSVVSGNVTREISWEGF